MEAERTGKEPDDGRGEADAQHVDDESDQVVKLVHPAKDEEIGDAEIP